MRVLFCTEAGGGYGFGHLRRCLAIIEEGGGSFDSFIHVRNGGLRDVRRACDGCSCVKSPDEVENPDLVLTDLRDTRAGVMKRLVRKAPVVALDDLGAGRKQAHFTVYALPNLEGECGNCSGPRYLVTGGGLKNVRPLPFYEKKGVLVSFGGSDPFDLTGFVVPILNEIGIEPTVVAGPLFKKRPAGVRAHVLENPDRMHELINGARVLITSFGLTMYEAFYLRTPVILFNHSEYHFRLAETVSDLNLGYRGSMDRDRLREALAVLLGDEKRLSKSARRAAGTVDGRGAARVVSLMKNASRSRRRDCFFRHGRYTAVRRSPEYTLFRCRVCGDLFLRETEPLPPIYDGESYFIEEYRRQYGRTYIEDRETIEKVGQRRFGVLRELAGASGTLLDVGCALGFFLRLAAAGGWRATGVEISSFAARWGRENLSADIREGSFLEVELPAESFDAVCFFFTAEHFSMVEELFEKAHRLLKRGGVVAFALPNRSGISYRLRRRSYLREHPRDHYFDTTPRNLTGILRENGFRKRRIYSTGIHPERFFGTRFGGKRGGVLDLLYTACAKALRLGDTFEYYGTKI